MGPKALVTAVLALLMIGIGSAGAHHSVAGQFDNAKRTKITGTISKIDWINPHSYIYLDVKSDKGEVTTWRLESLPTAMLRKAGLTSEMLAYVSESIHEFVRQPAART